MCLLILGASEAIAVPTASVPAGAAPAASKPAAAPTVSAPNVSASTVSAPNASASTGSCAAVRGNVAHAICVDPKLSRLNREVRSLYRKSLLVGDKRSQIANQSSWMSERNRVCASKQGTELFSCVAQSFNARILELHNVLAPEAAVVPAASATENLAVAVAPPTPVQAPKANSNCESAIGNIASAICNDATLSHWENRLGKFYQQALDDPSSRSILAQDQPRWLGERSDSCGKLSAKAMNDCVLQMTKRRIEQLVQVVIESRNGSQDRPSKIATILAGKSALPPGLDADNIDRESARTDQSELVIEDARNCIRKNVGATDNGASSNSPQLVEQVSAVCFDDFSRKLSALELGALAKPSFEMLVRQELSASK
jgi:uncharacterized protein